MKVIYLSDDQALALDALLAPITITDMFDRLEGAGFTAAEVKDLREALVSEVLLTDKEKVKCRKNQQGH